MIAKWCGTQWKRNYDCIASCFYLIFFIFLSSLFESSSNSIKMWQLSLFSISFVVIALICEWNASVSTYRLGFGRTILWLTLVMQTGLRAPAKCSTPAIDYASLRTIDSNKKYIQFLSTNTSNGLHLLLLQTIQHYRRFAKDGAF